MKKDTTIYLLLSVVIIKQVLCVGSNLRGNIDNEDNKLNFISPISISIVNLGGNSSDRIFAESEEDKDTTLKSVYFEYAIGDDLMDDWNKDYDVYTDDFYW